MELQIDEEEKDGGAEPPAYTTQAVRKVLRNVQQDIQPTEVARLKSTLDKLDRSAEMSTHNRALHRKISTDLSHLSEVIISYDTERNPQQLKKISTSSVDLQKHVDDMTLPTTVANCAYALEQAEADSQRFHLLEVALALICDSISHKKFNPTHVKLFFLKLVDTMPKVANAIIWKFGQALANNLFAKSVDAFTIFADFFFASNINDNNSLSLFSGILSDKKMAKVLQHYDLSSLGDIFVKYFEGTFTIWDIKFARCVSRFVRLCLPIDIVGYINYSLSKEDFHLQPLYYEFMMNGDNEEKIQFIQILLDSRKLHYFDRLMVVEGTSKKILLNVMSQVTIPTQLGCCSYPTHPGFSARNLSLSKEKIYRMQMSRVNNTTFALHVRTLISNVRESIQPLFVRLLYFCAWNEGIPNQSNVKVDTTENGKVKRIAFLLNKFEELSLVGMNSYVLKRLDVAIPSLMDSSFDENIYRLRDILEHVSSVNVDRVNELSKIKKRVGKIKNGTVAVQGLFFSVFKSDDIFQWDAASLNDRLFYTYCYVTYPLHEFQRWSKELNENKDFSIEISSPKFYSRFEDPKLSKTLLGVSALKKYGYNFVQNSQLFAVFCALDTTDSGLNFFGKLGTGQGKSLVFALLALQYVKKGKKVVVFSCYDHLSKRDHANFAQFFSDHGVRSSHLTCGSKDEVTADVMYADMETFAQSYYQNIKNISTGDSDFIMEINSFNVALLDEFDALLIDAKTIGKWVYDQFRFFELSAFNNLEHAKNEFYDQLRTKPGLQDMFQRMEKDGNEDLIRSWTAGFSSRSGRTEVNKFGHRVSYVGGEWDQLHNGKFQLYYAKLDVFSYLLGVKTVVGLSGSISREQMGRFENVMKKPLGNDGTSVDGFKYMEIPPFYGLRGGKNTERVVKENCSTWSDSVAEDLEEMLSRKPPVPVLLFGDVNVDSDWNILKDIVEEKARKYRRKHQLIQEESQVESMALTYATDPEYITLATHVVGRGADFKVLPDVNRAGGLHVLIAGVPDNDARLLIQMKGRTARMDNDGSHSIILRGALPSNSAEAIKVEQFDKDISEVAHMVSSQLANIPYNKNYWQRWILIFNAIQKAESWPGNLTGESNTRRTGTLLSYTTNQESSQFIRSFQQEPPKKNDFCTIM